MKAIIIDNGAAGFSTQGEWSPSTAWPNYHGHSYRFCPPGTSGHTATWKASVGPGTYNIAVRWTPHKNRSTAAAFQVWDGKNEVFGPAVVNQKESPAGLEVDGESWLPLGQYMVCGNDGLSVVLTQQESGYVIADAVRIEKVW